MRATARRHPPVMQARGRSPPPRWRPSSGVRGPARRDHEALSAAGVPVYPQPGEVAWTLIGAPGPTSPASTRRGQPCSGHRPGGRDPAEPVGAAKLVRALPDPFRADAEPQPARSCRRHPWGERDRERRPWSTTSSRRSSAAPGAADLRRRGRGSETSDALDRGASTRTTSGTSWPARTRVSGPSASTGGRARSPTCPPSGRPTRAAEAWDRASNRWSRNAHCCRPPCSSHRRGVVLRGHSAATAR